MMYGPNGPELDRVNLPNVHEGEEGPKRAVGHHLAFRILPTLNNGGLSEKGFRDNLPVKP